jgi:hypothetical protein
MPIAIFGEIEIAIIVLNFIEYEFDEALLSNIDLFCDP